MAEQTELAYRRKARKRGKHRKVRLEQVGEDMNILLAVKNSRRGKERNKGVVLYDRNAEANNRELAGMIAARSYRTSEGHDCMRRCPCGKVRRLHKLPYYPDHIAHHALMQVLMPHFVRALYKESGASVKGRGMMYAKRRTERWIDEHKSAGRIYYVKLDFVKFYENVDQGELLAALSLFFGDSGIRWMLAEVVHTLPEGLGIGLYPIQTLTNFYMSILCREVCRLYDVKVEIYCDDVVVLGTDKMEVWKAVGHIKDYARERMHQPLHTNIGMQIVDGTHFLDFVGYRFYFGHTLLRKRMKERFKRAMHNLKDPMHRYRAAMSYKGWLMHCDGFNQWRKVTGMEDFDSFNIPDTEDRDADGKRIFQGQRVSPGTLQERALVFRDVEFDVKSKQHKSGKTNIVAVEENGFFYKFMTNNPKMVATLHWLADNGKFPFRGKIRNMSKAGLPDYRIVGVNA